MTVRHDFTLDRFQEEAIAAVDAGRSVLVAAPTSSGKTVVAEHAVDAALRAGGRAFYTAPIKALSNQKFRDLGDLFGVDRVGLMTGDQVVAPDAPAVVMTTEVLRNMLYAGSDALDALRWVVLDEVHFLEDPYRGAVWEEVVLNLAPEVGIVALSATVSNAEELGDWLRTVRGATDVVVERQRPVRLRSHYLVGQRGGRGRPRRLHRVDLRRSGRAAQAGRRFDVEGHQRHGRGRPGGWVTPRRHEVLHELSEAGMLPAIHFIFSRAGCDEARDQVVRDGVQLNDPDEAGAVEAHVRARLADVPEDDLGALGVDGWLEGLRRGVAAHHAGLVPLFKEVTEELFAAGLLKLVYATETLALGVNLPARSVVVDRLTKFTGETHEVLTPGQFTQLSGRAGRRGLDVEGHALVCWSPFIGYEKVAALADSRDFVLRSAFRPTYNMVANLVDGRTREEAVDLLSQSFAQFQVDRRVGERRRRDEDRRAEAERLRRNLADRRRSVPSGRPLDPADLRPGDVVDLDDGHVHVVLSVGQRSGGRNRIRTLDGGGRVATVDDADLVAPPLLVGSVEMPAPFLPDDPVFRREVRARLRALVPDGLPDGRPGGRPGGGGAGGSARRDDQRRLARLERQLAASAATAPDTDSDLAARLDAAHRVLEARGMADGWRLTQRGSVLTSIHHEADLLAAEALGDGLLDGLGPAMMAAVVSCLTYRKRGPGESAGVRLAGEYPDRVAALTALAGRIGVAERAVGLDPRDDPDPGFGHVVHAWASGAGLDEVLDDDLPGGEFVRNVRLVADLLRQVAAVAPPDVAAVAVAAGEAVDRGVVAMSSGRLDEAA